MAHLLRQPYLMFRTATCFSTVRTISVAHRARQSHLEYEESVDIYVAKPSVRLAHDDELAVLFIRHLKTIHGDSLSQICSV